MINTTIGCLLNTLRSERDCFTNVLLNLSKLLKDNKVYFPAKC